MKKEPKSKEVIYNASVEAKLAELEESRRNVVINLNCHDGAITALKQLLEPKPEAKPE